MKRTIAVLSLAVAMFGLSGCTSYYKVHDPTTGKDYYTTSVKKKGGSTTLKDGRTGNTVTVQNSEVSKITKEQYETGRYTTP
jgi:hypothetical protein